jgi:hypothetical protein
MLNKIAELAELELSQNKDVASAFNALARRVEFKHFVKVHGQYAARKSGYVNPMYDESDFEQACRIGVYDGMQRYIANPAKPLKVHIKTRLRFHTSKLFQVMFSKKEQAVFSAIELAEELVGEHDFTQDIILSISIETLLQKYLQNATRSYKKHVDIFLYKSQGYSISDICKKVGCSDVYAYDALNSIKRYLYSNGLFQ